MRKILFLLAIIFCMGISAQNKSFTRWSFTPEYGYNYFGSDAKQSLFKWLPTSVNDITFGASVECALTPVWGLSLDGYVFPLRAKDSLTISTDLYNADLNLTVNLTRLIFPQSKSKIYFNGSIGLGAAYYIYGLQDGFGNSLTANDPAHLFDGTTPLTYGIAPSIPVTLSMEYNFSKPVSVGLKAHYRTFMADNLEGSSKLKTGVTNDFVGAGTIFLRYKFGSTKKNHLRNIPMDIYQPDKGLLLAKELEGKLNKLDSKVDTIGAKVDSLMPRLARLEKILSNDGPDSDGDGVPDVRDNEKNTPPNTPVDFWGKTIPLENALKNSSKGKAISIPEETPSVYFDFDRIDLDDAALITISKVAARMKADPTLYVEVRGYSDFSGNIPYNNLLSQRRSDRVKAELIKVWQIPFDHIISNGKGKALQPKTKYKPNRRCDFYFGRL